MPEPFAEPPISPKLKRETTILKMEKVESISVPLYNIPDGEVIFEQWKDDILHGREPAGGKIELGFIVLDSDYVLILGHHNSAE